MSRGRGCLAEVNAYQCQTTVGLCQNYNTRSFMSLERCQTLFCKTDRFAEVVAQGT